MKLFLASRAVDLNSTKRLEEFVKGYKGKKIAYVVTAGNGEGWGSWNESNTINVVRGLGAELKVVQLEDYWNKDVMSEFEDIDIIWFIGGYAGYLMYWMRRTGLDKKIKEILDKGVVYVGSSAGSWIASKTLDVPEWYIGEEEVGAGIIPGLGLVDFDIYPHYDEKDLEQTKKLYKGNKLYLLKNGEQVVVDGDKVEVWGEERIIGL